MAKATPDESTSNRRNKNDRRDNDRRKADVTVENDRRVSDRRAKVPRRRQIDPTTCERDYSDDEVEFMNAVERYKRSSGRMFPTCSEILEVLRGLGYAKVNQIQVIEELPIGGHVETTIIASSNE